MSAYIVNDETISVLVKGLENYNVILSTDYNGIARSGWLFDLGEMRQATGQKLLNENYRSVNFRYKETTKPHTFKYKDIAVNDSMIYGCIDNFEYQACETRDYYQTEIHWALMALKDRMLAKYLKQSGNPITYGYNGIEY